MVIFDSYKVENRDNNTGTLPNPNDPVTKIILKPTDDVDFYFLAVMVHIRAYSQHRNQYMCEIARKKWII